MVLEKDEYVVYDDKITISKKALEECRDHYRKVADSLHESFVFADEEEQPKKKRQKVLSMFYALLMCLFYVVLAIGANILLHKLFGLYCGIDSITFSMVFTIIWVLCYIYISED